MSKIPAELFYTREHEWVRTGDGSWRVGITDFAQESLGDVTFVELPEVGTRFGAGETFGVIESVKAASDLFMPVAGEIVAVNGALDEAPEQVNDDPYGEGWIIAIKIDAGVGTDGLLEPNAYELHVQAAG